MKIELAAAEAEGSEGKCSGGLLDDTLVVDAEYALAPKSKRATFHDAV